MQKNPWTFLANVCCAALLVFYPRNSASAAPVFTTLYTFGSLPLDGVHPVGGVLFGPAGILYGVTQGGGAANYGTIYALFPPAAAGGGWTESHYSFAGGHHGREPLWPLVQAGNRLFGLTVSGNLGKGTAFYVKPPTSPAESWLAKVFYEFPAGTPGYHPVAGVTAAGGALYGTNTAGGLFGEGNIFSLTPPESSGGAWTETVLYNWPAIAQTPEPTLIQAGPDGVFYGTTLQSGAHRCGSVYTLTPPGSPGGTWTFNEVYSFTCGLDGSQPQSPLVITSTQGGQTLIYGATRLGGLPNNGGCVFSLLSPASPGGTWTETTLHDFAGDIQGDNPDGAMPQTGPVMGLNGVLYGATTSGGRHSAGVIFALAPPTAPGGPWTETILHDFSGVSSDWGNPNGLVLSSTGVLYGTTAFIQGAPTLDTVFSLVP